MNPARPCTLADPAKQSAGWLLAVASGFLTLDAGRAAAEDAPPDLELLEYLGSWEDAEEDWVLFSNADRRAAADDGQGEAAEDSEKSQESDDER